MTAGGGFMVLVFLTDDCALGDTINIVHTLIANCSK